MLRAIWSAMVVLPDPWAPPISNSSPGRMPPPMVLSSGTNPVAMGWNSSILPDAMRSLRLVRTSRAERGASVPSPASKDQAGASVVVVVAGGSSCWLGSWSGGLWCGTAATPLTLATRCLSLSDRSLAALWLHLAGASRRRALAAWRKDAGEERFELLALDRLLLDEQARQPIQHRALLGEGVLGPVVCPVDDLADLLV